jgi:BirA family biotin operon repressor/biotin-[acetyl-CoA-carboxylase] ligase
LKIILLDSIPSTQNYLIEQIKLNQLKPPVAVITNSQTDGIGSRGNSWIGVDGNLFLSFALDINDIPRDTKIESLSIYFSYLMKMTLCDMGSLAIFKWPNDIYIQDKKIGGIITNLIQNRIVVCGIGLNIKSKVEDFGILDINISRDEILDRYFELLSKKIDWNTIFSKLLIEYETTSKINGELNFDGSITLNGKRIYSNR